MGQKGSKVRGIFRKSPASSGTSPLNNATYWEAEEDPEWDNCVMVVATHKGRQRLPDSDDSLARSLHKDVDYPAINVSRRSPDHTDTPLGPDSRYPHSAGTETGQRKRQNTLLDTGWHACFKNNNYVFVRNGSGARCRQYGEKWKDTNSDVTFVIATTDADKNDHKHKLVVSLQDPKPEVVEPTAHPPTTENRSTETSTSNGDAKITLEPRQGNSSGKKNKKSDKKKSSNWLKKFTPGRSKLKLDATPEETVPICESSPDESPESCENVSVLPSKGKKTIRIPPGETPVKVVDLIGKGPHTSTPKHPKEIERMYKTLPRGGPTPFRPVDSRYSVRRRLPYEDSSSKQDESLFQVSPLRTTIDGVLNNPHLSLDLSPLERRASCHRRIIESPKFQNRLHPTDSMSDIPFADSVEEVFDESPRPEINRVNSSDFVENMSFESRPCPRVSQENLSDIMENVSFDERPRPRISRANSSDILERVSFDERSRPKVTRTYSSELIENVSFDERPRPRTLRQDDSVEAPFNEALRRRITRANSVAVRPRYRERCFSEPIDDKTLANIPEIRSNMEQSVNVRSFSSSEPSLRVKRAQSCRSVQKAASPMEEEENQSLNWKAKQLRSPDDSTVTFSPYVRPDDQKKSSTRENPVLTWLKELRLLTETECLHALQAKEIFKEDWIANALAVGNAQEKSERIWEAGTAVGKHVEEMTEALKKPKLSSTPFSLRVAQFCAAVVDLLKMGTSTEDQIVQVEARINKSCAQLLAAVHKDEEIEEWKSKMVSELQSVQESLKIIVRQLLSKQLQVIVESVDKASNINSLKRSVFALILLGRLDSTFCEIVVQLGAVRSLLAIIVELKWKEMHPCALRALTVLSCIPTAIKSFEESGGVDCVCDVLCEEQTPEGARSEAAGLVAQITAPWTEGNGYVLPSINQNADRLVKSIASLVSATESSEVFLLSSAALANLSFSDEVLKKMEGNRVLEILVGACRNNAHASSLFIKDQVATVLANMAAKEEYRLELCSGGSLVLLLCFLQLRPSVGHGAPQLAACERIQQKAAIALARLCTNPETSNIVAEMQGIQRLVKLCKDRKERNDSDSVLVACLAALRKIAAVRQKEEFKKLGAQELIEPRLWDAFMAHSSKRESYV